MTVAATSTATATASTTRTPTSTATPVNGGKLKLKPKSIKFGKVAVGSVSKSHTIQIKNAGTVAMLAAVPTQGAPFVVNGGEFIVSPHGSTKVALQFVLKLKGPARATLTITSSDPEHRTVVVKVSGTGR